MTFKYTFLMTLFFITNFITGNVSAAPTYFDLKTECIEPGGTRYFEGYPVTLDCWRKIVTYACRVNLDNNCQQLGENVQDEALEYPIEQCDKSEDIDCDENIFSDFDFDEMDFSSLSSDMYDIKPALKSCDSEDDLSPKSLVCGAVNAETFSRRSNICGEETESTQIRICENVPHVVITGDPYPGCRRHISPSGIEDCLAGHIQIPHYRGDGYGKALIPKNRGSRVVFSNSKHGYCYVTIFSEITGQHVVSPRARVNNNMYIELPFSKIQDQTFSFIIHRSDGCSCNKPGHLNVYVNYLRKIPKVEWKEESCKEESC